MLGIIVCILYIESNKTSKEFCYDYTYIIGGKTEVQKGMLLVQGHDRSRSEQRQSDSRVPILNS